ncbi:MAG: hypothetical protein ABIE14_05310 [Patescibacteria group bacterium]
MKQLPKILIFGILFLLNFSKVYALAGFGEFDKNLIYNEEIEIYLGRPSDGCWPAGHHCFKLYWKDKRKERNIPNNLQQINVPPNNRFIFAQDKSGGLIKRCKISKEDEFELFGSNEIFSKKENNDYECQYSSTGKWIIFDLKNNEKIFEAEKFLEALERWQSFDLEYPKFANVYNIDEFFEETKESKSENFEINLFFLVIFIFIFVIATISSIDFFSDKQG